MRRNGSHIKGLLYHCKVACDPILSTNHQERAKTTETANSQSEHFREFPEGKRKNKTE